MSMSVTTNCEEDVLRIKKKLEKMMKTNDINLSTITDMLNVLKSSPINLQILQSTRIGVVVNNLRKACNSEELGTLAKNLLKSWKKLVPSEGGTSGGGGGNGKGGDGNPVSPSANSNDTQSMDQQNSPSPLQSQSSFDQLTTPPPSLASMQSQSNLQTQSSTQSLSSHSQRQNSIETPTKSKNGSSVSSASLSRGPSTASSNGGGGGGGGNGQLQRTTSTTSTHGTRPSLSSSSSSSTVTTINNIKYTRSVSYTETRDPIRVKSRSVLAKALELSEKDQVDPTLQLFDPITIAARCEDAIFNEFKSTESKYKNRIASRIANLKDPKNPKLRESVLLSYISPEKLATMSAEEMASDELKQIRDKYTKEAIDDHQMAVQTGNKSSLLKCRKCKNTNCGYTEMQTRSADEPMTVFAYCLDCGFRWKQ